MPQTYNSGQIGALQGIKGLIYGKSGVGKTFLATTAPSCYIVATEPGLLSVRDYNIPFCYARTVSELDEVARWIAGSVEARQYATFLFDSVSETLEIILAAERIKAGKEPRRAYGELAIQAVNIIKMYRDLAGPNIIFTAKQEYDKDGDSGAMLFQPRFPGKETGINAPYLFDFVFNLFVHEDVATKAKTRVLRTSPNNQYEAKDRSGRLNEFEPAHLGHVFNKIMGVR